MAGPAIPFLVRTFGKQIFRSGLQFGGGGTGSALVGAFAGSNRNGIGLNITVGSNIGQLARTIDAFGKQQLPFATSQALNDAAFATRKQNVERTYPQSFDVKNKRFAATMYRVEKSNKRNLTARVYDRLGRDYMVNQAEGGVKRPRGNNIAIPSRAIKRTASGKVPKAKQPRNVLNARGYKTKLRSGQDVIAQQTGRGAAKRQQVLYLLEQRAYIPKRFRFYEDGQRTAQRSFNRAFATRFREAQRTSKR